MKPPTATPPSATPRTSPPNDEMVTVKDIRHAEMPGVDARLHGLDVHAPKGAKAAPVMVFVHGGSWTRGDKRQVGNLPAVFVSEGFICVSVNYRLAPAVRFDAQAHDIAAAVAWVRKHASEYGGAPEKLVLMGHSAGAHLATLVATHGTYLKTHELPLSVLRALVPLDGDYALKLLSGPNGKLPELYDAPFTQDPVQWAKASPMTHVAQGEGLPPAILVYSGGFTPNSSPRRRTDAEAFAARLKTAGVTTEVVAAPEKSHLQIASEFGASGDRIAERVFAFLMPLLAAGTANAVPSAGPTPISKSRAFLDLRFTKDYFPGAKDRGGQLMGGVECNYIAAHKGELYATVSTWKQEGWNHGKTTGPQVLVKKAHDAAWEVDHTFGPEYGRAECLRSVQFSTDHTGRKLDRPVALLLASTTGLGSKEIGLWSRDDATGQWTRMTMGSAGSGWGTEIRALIDHVDRVTGTHSVFAAATEGLIYRGAYDPQAPGGVAWESQPEYRRPSTMPVQRVPASCEAGGVLYVSLEMDPKSPGSGGVFRRVDGPKPRWEHVYEWTHSAAEREARMGHKQDRLVYGLAGVSDPRDPSRETLICVRDLRAQVLDVDLSRIDQANRIETSQNGGCTAGAFTDDEQW